MFYKNRRQVIFLIYGSSIERSKGPQSGYFKLYRFDICLRLFLLWKFIWWHSSYIILTVYYIHLLYGMWFIYIVFTKILINTLQ